MANEHIVQAYLVSECERRGRIASTRALRSTALAMGALATADFAQAARLFAAAALYANAALGFGALARIYRHVDTSDS